MSSEEGSFKFLASTSEEKMAAADPLCCHFALAKNLAEKKMTCGVEARDKLLMDAIEAKQEGIFANKEGLAETDKGKKILKSVLKLVRIEVENLEKNCDLHGFWQLGILNKSSGVIGGVLMIEDSQFSFLVDNKKKKYQMGLTMQKLDNGFKGEYRKEYPAFCNMLTAQSQVED